MKCARRDFVPTRWAAALHVVALASAFVVTACSLVYPADQVQCIEDRDCGADVCQDGLCAAADNLGQWGCAGRRPPPDTYDPSVRVRVNLTVAELYTDLGARGGSARPCAIDDLQCANPRGPVASFNATATATLDFPQGLVGYVDMQAEGFLPTMLALGDVVVGGGYGLFSLSETSLRNRLFAAGGTPLSDRGQAVIIAVSCTLDPNAPADGVQVAVDGAERIDYLERGMPVPTRDRTGTEGLSAALNVEPGMRRLVVTHADSGDTIADTAVPVRPGALTVAIVYPSRRSP